MSQRFPTPNVTAGQPVPQRYPPGQFNQQPPPRPYGPTAQNFPVSYFYQFYYFV